MTKTILSVDNEPLTANLVKDILEKKGYKVLTALTGIQCLRKLEENKNIDLVLLDIMMPDMSGWDVYERIRQKNKKVKVAFLSIIDISPHRKSELKKRGLSDYISKPFTSKEIIRRVSLLLD